MNELGLLCNTLGFLHAPFYRTSWLETGAPAVISTYLEYGCAPGDAVCLGREDGAITAFLFDDAGTYAGLYSLSWGYVPRSRAPLVTDTATGAVLSLAATTDRAPNNNSKPLEGEVVCFTGTCRRGRPAMMKIARALGAMTNVGMGQAVTMLVAGEGQGLSNKHRAAKDRGIKIISAAAFYQMANRCIHPRPFD